MTYFLGIDAGGSKTDGIVGDKTSVLGHGRGGPGNVIRVGESLARESLQGAIHAACGNSGVSASQIVATCVGAAGGAQEEVRSAVHAMVSAIVGGRVAVVTDVEIALAAAFNDGPGMIVVAGTGSIAYGRDRHGKTMRVGGWGYAISDEGSAHWIGRRAVGAALRADDEGQAGPLLQEVMAAWEVRSREELVVKGNATPPPDFAALLPVVLKCSRAGDATAARVLQEAAAELAQLATILIGRLASDELPVAMCGGVFRNCELVRTIFEQRVKEMYPPAQFMEDTVDPVEGALAMARRMVP